MMELRFLMASSATAVVRSIVRRTEFFCIRDLSNGASRSTTIERGQYTVTANRRIFRKEKNIEKLTSCIIEALVCQCFRVTAYTRLNKAPYNAGSFGNEWGVKYSFLMELTTALVNGEHSEDIIDADMTEYRRVAARRKFIERRST